MDNYIGFVYLWINKINGMKYIGLHVGKVDDGYIGSGTYFTNAVQKYGKDSFDRSILHFEYESVQNLYKKEYELITLYNAVLDEMYYNQINISPNAFKWVVGKMIRTPFTEEHKNNIKNGRTGLKDSLETRKTKSARSGVKGKKYYNNGYQESRYFPGSEPNGWQQGRLKGMVPLPGSGLIWCNNGEIVKRFYPDAIPNEWTLGRLGQGGLSGDSNVSKRLDVREKISKALKGKSK